MCTIYMNEFSVGDTGHKHTHTHTHPHRHTLVIADFEDQSDWWTLSSCLSVRGGLHGDRHHKVGSRAVMF